MSCVTGRGANSSYLALHGDGSSVKEFRLERRLIFFLSIFWSQACYDVCIRFVYRGQTCSIVSSSGGGAERAMQQLPQAAHAAQMSKEGQRWARQALYDLATTDFCNVASNRWPCRHRADVEGLQNGGPRRKAGCVSTKALSLPTASGRLVGQSKMPTVGEGLAAANACLEPWPGC